MYIDTNIYYSDDELRKRLRRAKDAFRGRCSASSRSMDAATFLRRARKYGRDELMCSWRGCRKEEPKEEATDSEKKFLCCSRCWIERYCSKPCQKMHWRDGHREACSMLRDAMKKT